MAKEAITAVEIFNPQGTGSGTIAISSSSKFVDYLMSDSYVLIDFYDDELLSLPAFCYLKYDGAYYFIKEDYHPTRDGNTYHYEIKFVSLLHMLSKFIFFRYITLSDGTSWTEADYTVNCDIKTMLEIWLKSLKQCATQFATSCPVFMQLLNAFDVNLTIEDQTLNTYTYNGVDLYSALSTIVNANTDNTQEFWLTYDNSGALPVPTLNVGRCERGETITLTDEIGGNQIYSLEYANEWQNVTNTIIPFGAERNMEAQTITDADSGLIVSYGKRIRLDANTTYTVKGEDGTDVQITTNEKGGFSINGVTSKIEEVKMFEDVYPQCHYQVTEVYRSDSDIYTITLQAMDETNSKLYTNAEMYNMELCPFTNTMVQEGETLKIVFESGALSGQEFEVSNDPCKVTLTGGLKEAILKLQIKPNTIGDQQIPIGNFIPQGSTEYGKGDQVALFNMKMPAGFITNARQQLAQAAYDYLLEVEKTRPEVNMQGYVNYFQNLDIYLGSRVSITSPLFGTLDQPGTIVSRITKISHDLYFTSDYDTVVSSAQVVGVLASFESAIADVTADVRGVEQQTVAVSRRAYRDAQEMASMLDSMQTEMMLVGNEKTQFACSCSFTPNYGDATDNYNYLHISYGALQHTQEPYISYNNKGTWQGGNVTLNKAFIIDDETGKEKTEAVELEDDTPYYLYAKVTDSTATTEGTMEFDLHETAQDAEDHLLIGILSSVFEGKRTFNRTNGFSAITGGTITTEVIQDSSKKLIVDFPNATITARNGGRLRGVFEVMGADDSTPISELSSIDIGDVSEGNINPVENDLSYTRTNPNISSGEEYLVSIWDTDGSSSGSTIYPCRWSGNNGSSLAHDWYMLPEANAVALEKGKSFVAKMRITIIRSGYKDVKWWEGRETYDESGAETFEQEYMYFFIKWTSASAGTSGIKKNYFYMQTNDDGNVVVPSEWFSFVLPYTSDMPSDAVVSCGFRIYTDSHKFHSSEAYFHFGFIGNMYLKEGTDIDSNGGLVSSLYVLLDGNKNVIGGLSGLSSKVAMWEGGTYSDAYLHPEKLPFYISKDSNGAGSKIGPLTVEDPETLAITTKWNKIYLSTHPIDYFIGKVNAWSKGAGALYTFAMTNTHDGVDFSIWTTSTTINFPSDIYSIKDAGLSLKLRLYSKRANLSETFLLTITEGFVQAFTGAFSFDFTIIGDISKKGTTTFKAYKPSETGTVIDHPLFDWGALDCTGWVTQQSSFFYIIYLKGSYYATGDHRSWVWADLILETKGLMGTAQTNNGQQIVIAKDGICVQNSGVQQFVVKNDSDNLNIQCLGLPTSETGLSAGQLYTDNGYLKVATTASVSSSAKVASVASEEESAETTTTDSSDSTSVAKEEIAKEDIIDKNGLKTTEEE